VNRILGSVMMNYNNIPFKDKTKKILTSASAWKRLEVGLTGLE